MPPRRHRVVPGRSRSTVTPAVSPSIPPSVVLLVSDAARCAWLRRHLLLRAPGCRVELAGDPVDAVVGATRVHAELVLIDRAATADRAAALVRLLGRNAPDARVMVFDDAERVQPAGTLWPWDDAERQIDRWLASRGAETATDGGHA